MGKGPFAGAAPKVLPLHLPGVGALANQVEAGVSDLILAVMTEHPLNAQSALGKARGSGRQLQRATQGRDRMKTGLQTHSMARERTLPTECHQSPSLHWITGNPDKNCFHLGSCPDSASKGQGPTDFLLIHLNRIAFLSPPTDYACQVQYCHS